MNASLEIGGLTPEGLWGELRPLLDPADDKALGDVHDGTTDADKKLSASSNNGEDRVNLTLAMTPDHLELNVTGWKVAEADALKAWLQSVRGDTAVNGLPGYEVIGFKRIGHRKTPKGRVVFQGVEKIEELGAIPASGFNPGLISRWSIRVGDAKLEKLAFHIRRAWPREEAESLGPELPATVAAEVSRLMPILREIWHGPRATFP